MANNHLIELATRVAKEKGNASREDKYELSQILGLLRDKGATNPQVHYEINQIITRTADEIFKPSLDFLDYVADTQRVGHGEKIEFQIPAKTKMRMSYTGRGVTVDYQRMGFSRKFTSTPEVISGGAYYEIDQLLSGNISGFTGVVDALVKNMQDQVTNRVIGTMASAPVPAVNKWSGAGIAPANFSDVASIVQRYDRNVVCVADIDLAKKIGGFVGADRMSDAMKEAINQNGYFTTVDGVDVIVFSNPFSDDDTDNTKLSAPREFGFIMPASIDNKPVKIGFEGGMEQYTDTDINSERVFLKTTQKVSIDVFHDLRNIGILEDTTLA